MAEHTCAACVPADHTCATCWRYELDPALPPLAVCSRYDIVRMPDDRGDADCWMDREQQEGERDGAIAKPAV